MKIALIACICQTVIALPSVTFATDPHPGYEVIRNSQFLVPDFDTEVLGHLWTVWPDDLKDKAKSASPDERRKMTFELYGIKPVPEVPDNSDQALGYVTPSGGVWSMNCLACHGGEINGQVIPGLGNTDFDLQSLSEDVRTVKQNLNKPLTHLDGAIGETLLSAGPGLTNAVNFGVDLGALRDSDMNVHLDRSIPDTPDYGIDAPPFWNVKYKQRLYCDNHAPNYHRVLMQFILHPWNNASFVKRQEPKFVKIQEWIQSVESPRYPFVVDSKLANRGRIVFNKSCAECHGTYGNGTVEYPERVVPLAEIGTDPVRLEELKPEFERWLQNSWMTEKDDGSETHHKVVIDSPGYVAPPLKGIWASAPYFHNGSVPTLWHILNPGQRPTVWRRVGKEYDPERVGHRVETWDALPEQYQSMNKYQKRRHYNTNDFGKSNRGHDYPAKLSQDQRRAVLEYLKTL